MYSCSSQSFRQLCPGSHFPTPDPGRPSSAWAEMGLKQKVRTLPLRSLEGSHRDDGRPFQHWSVQRPGDQVNRGTGHRSCQPASPAAQLSGLCKVSNRLRRYRGHSRASSLWFLKPSGIKAKFSDSESLRVTVAGSFLIPIPQLLDSRRFPLPLSSPGSRTHRATSLSLSPRGPQFPHLPSFRAGGGGALSSSFAGLWEIPIAFC